MYASTRWQKASLSPRYACPIASLSLHSPSLPSNGPIKSAFTILWACVGRKSSLSLELSVELPRKYNRHVRLGEFSDHAFPHLRASSWNICAVDHGTAQRLQSAIIALRARAARRDLIGKFGGL